jgi:hypothetical protein
MHALQFSVSIPQWIALKAAGMVTHKYSLENLEEMIEVNLAKAKHRAVKTVVSFI